ncbi:calcium-binding protein [Micromonospora sp. BQ11]|uniref:calcium-binding protein n=1 Tax=Micromonospora sp. BQ11 TaxID=3452212 RepID=UPI003F8871BA
MFSKRRSALFGVAFSTAVLGVPAAPAAAAALADGSTLVNRTGSVLTVTAGVNRANDITVRLVGATYVITDQVEGVSAGGACTLVGAEARCPAAGTTELVVNAGNLDDRVTVDTGTSAPVGASLHGGSGNDRLVAGAGNDTLDGEEGVDTLLGGGGNDTVNGGTGGDSAFGGAGNDSVGGQEGADSLQGGDGNDVVEGGGGADQLAGDGGDDLLDGGAGRDRVTGGVGRDTLLGGGGDDVLDGFDGLGGNDRLFGGTGTDTCFADPGDPADECP